MKPKIVLAIGCVVILLVALFFYNKQEARDAQNKIQESSRAEQKETSAQLEKANNDRKRVLEKEQADIARANSKADQEKTKLIQDKERAIGDCKQKLQLLVGEMGNDKNTTKFSNHLKKNVVVRLIRDAKLLKTICADLSGEIDNFISDVENLQEVEFF